MGAEREAVTESARIGPFGADSAEFGSRFSRIRQPIRLPNSERRTFGLEKPNRFKGSPSVDPLPPIT